jgi:hypothetical protein
VKLLSIIIVTGWELKSAIEWLPAKISQIIAENAQREVLGTIYFIDKESTTCISPSSLGVRWSQEIGQLFKVYSTA